MPGSQKRFFDRKEAGQALAVELRAFKNRSDTIVLALPRGGVPVASEVATALSLPLDILLVRKLGVPGQSELAMGAIATGDTKYIDDDIVSALQISPRDVADATAREKTELDRRNSLYRGNAPPTNLKGKTVIVVDDGLATGSTMLAAVASLKQAGVRRVVIAVPVAPPATCQALAAVANEIHCARQPDPFYGVGAWYADFRQVTDAEVVDILTRHRKLSADAHPDFASLVARYAIPVKDDDFAPVVSAASGLPFVLLGEASHGTEEFYEARARITQDLIEAGKIDAVAVEADWPDAHRVHEYVTHKSADTGADEALSGFERFPTWMWRNTVVQEFVEFLRDWNASNIHHGTPIGFYGLDLYSLSSSAKAVIGYLESVDPAAAEQAKARYGCLDHHMRDPQAYGYAAALGITKSCEDEIVEQLSDMLSGHLRRAPGIFSAQQNAKLVRAAEKYYREMFSDTGNSWNMRDRHMYSTLEDISAHLGEKLKRPARIAVWAHNSHLGDARATDMGQRRGELNLGQLVREHYPAGCLSVGFSTSTGTVTAASDWDSPPMRCRLRPPVSGSYEDLFSRAGIDNFMIDLRQENPLTAQLREQRVQRAVGVIYRPETERYSHYFHASLPAQFDFLIHYNQTTALQPLGDDQHMRAGELDETYPYGI